MSMKKKIMVITCYLVLAASTLSFAQDKKASSPGLSANEYAKGKAVLKRSNDSDNSEVHKASRRAKRRAERKAKIEKRKSDMQTGSDPQVNVKF